MGDWLMWLINGGVCSTTSGLHRGLGKADGKLPLLPFLGDLPAVLLRLLFHSLPLILKTTAIHIGYSIHLHVTRKYVH